MTDLLSQAGADVDPRDLRAQQAIIVFRSKQAGLTGFARALTGNKSASVELATGPPRTDGSKIYLKPPIELGDKHRHVRKLCDKRDPVSGTLLCFACKAHEEVLVALYHEVGHIAGGTFEKASNNDQVTAVENSIEAYGSKYAELLKIKIARAPQWQRDGFLGLAGLVSPYLPIIVNSLEDTRVDKKMFEARKGTKVMFDAWVYRTFADGVEQADGSRVLWSKYPLNSQAMVGLFIVSCGYEYRGWFAPPVEEALGDQRLNELISRMDTVRSVRGVYELAFPILARLKELGFCLEPQDDFEPDDEEAGNDSEPDSDSSDESDSGDDGSEAGSDDSDGEGDALSSKGSDGGADDQSSESTGDSDDTDESDSELSGRKMGDVSGGEDSDDGEDVSEGGEQSEPSESSSASSGDPGGTSDGESDEGVLDESDQDDVSSESDEDSTTFSDGESEYSGSADEGQVPEDSDGGQHSEPQPDEGDAGEGEGSDASESAGQQGSGDSFNSGEGMDSEGSEPSEDDSQVGSRDVHGRGEEEDAPPPSEHTDDGEGPTPADDEPLDTGADEGMGGIQTEEYDYGTAADVEDLVKVIGHHDEVIPQVKSYEDQLNDKALDVAIMQGLYFEKPSAFIKGVRIHKYGQPIMEDGTNQSIGWPRIIDPAVARRRGVLADTLVDESVLGPALLETRRVFADNSRVGHEHNRKSGRINRRVLGRRAPVEDPRLFTKKRLPKKKSYAVLIGVDISGSTYGVNLVLAKRAARAQAELCHRVGIPFSVWAHTAQYPKGSPTLSNGLTLDHYLIKDFNDTWDTNAIAALNALGSTHENLDGHSIEVYRKALERQEATDRILMYYTDGKMPAANHNEELRILQREIKYCQLRGIALMGVGIRTDSPVRHGLDTIQVDTDEDLVKVVRHLEKKLVHASR